jgi:hypothetical protein
VAEESKSKLMVKAITRVMRPAKGNEQMKWRFWRWTKRDNDISDEIAHDLAADAEERVRPGIPRAEAELASRRDFGNVSHVKEDVREIWIWASLQGLSQDVRYGWRTLRSNFLAFLKWRPRRPPRMQKRKRKNRPNLPFSVR